MDTGYLNAYIYLSTYLSISLSLSPKVCRSQAEGRDFLFCVVLHAPMDFAIGKGYVQPRRSPREATVRRAFVPADVGQGRGERRWLRPHRPRPQVMPGGVITLLSGLATRMRRVARCEPCTAIRHREVGGYEKVANFPEQKGQTLQRAGNSSAWISPALQIPSLAKSYWPLGRTLRVHMRWRTSRRVRRYRRATRLGSETGAGLWESRKGKWKRTHLYQGRAGKGWPVKGDGFAVGSSNALSHRRPKIFN